MSATDLRFFKRRPVSTALRFGDTPPPAGDVYITASLAAVVSVGSTAALAAVSGYIATLNAAVDLNLTPNLAAIYDNSVNRAPHLWADTAWEVAHPAPSSVAARHRVSARAEATPSSAIGNGQPLPVTPSISWRQADSRQRRETGVAWVSGLPLDGQITAHWRDLLPLKPPVTALFAAASPLAVEFANDWQDLHRYPRPEKTMPWGDGKLLTTTLIGGFGVGRPIPLNCRLPWGEGRRPPHGEHTHVTPPSHVPCYTPNTALVFWALARTTDFDLLFRCPNARGDATETLVIPIRRTYIVVNEIHLIRVSNMSPIKATSLSVSFDCDSWLPSFNANIPEAARESVMPDPSPVEVEISINGAQFRFLVEKIIRNRQFAQAGVSISGRGIACELESPYAVASQHTNTIDMTAQQIIDAALGFTAYQQNWSITDWLVPANAFSLYGSPASVAGAVAEASGSVLSADRKLRQLKMQPRYPVKPWEWSAATPDYVIPSAVAQTESLEWIEKPAYNVVYVSGVQNGVLGQVKITGTAGDLPAPMVTHALITHADAARQRGISILSDTGRKAMLQISMPVLESTGVIDVCKLIQFNDGATARRGIVRANNISVNWPTVRQVLTVEAAA